MTTLNRYQTMLRERRISRRSFIEMAVAAGVSLSGAMTLANQALAQEKPKRGGHLKIGSEGANTTDTLDPTLALTTIHYLYMFSVYNNLVELSSDKELVPELAESWEAKNAQEWIFNIRKGVEFHNGKTLDANDVVYSIRRHIDKDSKSAAKGYLADITDIKAETPHQVRITLGNGNADLPYILNDFHLGIVPDGHTDWSKAVGTGPYKQESFQPGVTAVFKRNSNYWKKDRAWVDSVEIAAINDPTARMAALQSGQMNAISKVDRKTADMLAKVPGLKLVRSPAGNYQTTAMRTNEGVFVDNNVRLAMKHAVDRKKLVDVVFRGFADVGNDHPVPKSDPFYNSELPQRTQDPDKVKFYLKKAGLSTLNVDLHSSVAAFSEAIDFATVIQESAKSTGININVIRDPADGYYKNVWMKVDFAVVNWGVRPTLDLSFSLNYKSDSKWNDTHWKNDRFDKVLLEARVALDQKKRKELYWEAQKIVYEEHGNFLPTFGDYVDGYAASVKGGRPDQIRELLGCRAAERLWIEA